MAILHKLYDIMDKALLRGLSLVMSLLLAGCIFWEPARFAAKTSDLAIWQGLLLMWAVCTGVNHGVGFRPGSVFWQTFFSPLPALIVMASGLVWFFL